MTFEREHNSSQNICSIRGSQPPVHGPWTSKPCVVAREAPGCSAGSEWQVKFCRFLHHSHHCLSSSSSWSAVALDPPRRVDPMNRTCEGSRWQVPYESCPETIHTPPQSMGELSTKPAPGARSLGTAVLEARQLRSSGHWDSNTHLDLRQTLVNPHSLIPSLQMSLCVTMGPVTTFQNYRNYIFSWPGCVSHPSERSALWLTNPDWRLREKWTPI